MKKVLLATSALALTAGVAHAEITFSGKAEAGIYRSAPTAGSAAVAGRLTTTSNNTSVTAAASATAASTATSDKVEYVDGVLTTVKAGGTLGSITADSTTTTAQTAAMVAYWTQDVADKTADLATAEAALQTLVATSTPAAIDAAIDTVAAAKADLARSKAVLANMSGSAAVAKGAMPKSTAYSGYDFNVVGSATTDGGMTFGVDFDMGAGLIADQDDDRAMDAQGAAVAAAKVTMSYAGVNVAVKQDGIDDLYDDSQNGDLSVSGSVAGLSYTIVTDFDDDVKAVAASTKFTAASGTAGAADYKNATFTETAAVAAVYNPTSYSLGYTVGDLALSYVGTEHSDNGSAANKISATYTMGDLKVTATSDSKGNLKDVNSLALAYSAGGLGITLTVKDDANHVLNTNKSKKQSQDIKVTYSAGALGFTAATDESSNWWVNAKYDLGGGAQAFTTVDHTDFAVVGVNFAF